MVIETKPAGIWTFIALTWRSVVRAIGKAPLVFAGGFVALAAIGVGAQFLERLISEIPSSSWLLRQAGGAAELVAVLVRLALISLALAPIAVTVHRLVILDDAVIARAGRYAQWLFGFLLFWEVVQLPSLMFGAGSFALEWLAIGIVGAVVLRSALLFPAVATDVPASSIKERVEESWRIATGHLRRLFAVWFCAGLPFNLAALVLSRPAGDVAPKPGLHIVAAVLVAAVTVMEVAVSAAVTSWVYLWVLDHPKEPVKP